MSSKKRHSEGVDEGGDGEGCAGLAMSSEAAWAKALAEEVLGPAPAPAPDKKRRVVRASGTAEEPDREAAMMAAMSGSMSGLTVSNRNTERIVGAIVTAANGRDSQNPYYSSGHSSSRGLTSSNGPGAAFSSVFDEPDGAESVIERLAPFFGIPSGPVHRDSHLGAPVDVYDLPKAYEGSNKMLTRVIFNQVLETDMALLKFCLPIRRHDGTEVITYNKMVYDPALLGRVPYESPSRLVTSHRETRSIATVRFGLGAMSEYGFWLTEEGKFDWLQKQDQIAYAVQRTAALGAATELLSVMKRPASIAEDLGIPVDAMAFKESIDAELSIWNIVTRFDGVQLLGDLQRKELTDRRVVAGAGSLMLVLPSGADTFTVHADEHRKFLETGKPRETYDDPSSIRVRGIGRIHISQPFLVGPSQPPIDPFYRMRAIGYRYVMTGLPVGANLSTIEDYKTDYSSIKVYADGVDDFVVISHKDAFDNNLWYRADGVMTDVGHRCMALHSSNTFATEASSREGKAVTVANYYESNAKNFKTTARIMMSVLETDEPARTALANMFKTDSEFSNRQAALYEEVHKTGKATLTTLTHHRNGAPIAPAGKAAKDLDDPNDLDAGDDDDEINKKSKDSADAYVKILNSVSMMLSNPDAANQKLHSSKSEEGIRYMLSLLFMTGAREFFHWCYNHNVPVPIPHIIFAPHVTYEMGQSLLVVGGSGTGWTRLGNPDACVGLNPKTKLVSLSFTVNMRSHVVEPRNVVPTPNVLARRYIGGCAPGEWHTLEDRVKYGEEDIRKSFFSIACPVNFECKMPYTDVTGRFNAELTKDVGDWNNPTPGTAHYPYASVYATFWDWTPQNYNPFDYSMVNPLQWKSNLCFQSLQFMYSQNGSKCDIWGSYIPDKGHWRSSVTDTNGMQYRLGRAITPQNFIPLWQRSHRSHPVMV